MRIVATAGHVDHGKSTLVTFLTGTDPDRLAEEKRRGLTIDLGFAATTFPSGREVGFVDVPGHTRFIKNMLAGVGAIDACLFVVAANDGWRPQSEEHLRVLELLGISHGLVALTKVGLVDDEWRELIELELTEHVRGTFLEGAPVVAVDAPTGVGGDELVAALDRMLAATPEAADLGRPRLWIDRSFPIRGSGTVVTGSLIGGSLRVGDHLVVEPQGTEVRVRALQSHGRELDTATPGRRLAVNLVGVGHQEVARGDALVRPGQWHRCTVLDASLEVMASLGREVGRRGAYLGYFGSGEHLVRLRPVGGAQSIASRGSVRIWLPEALPLVPGDHYVLRDAGRQETVGGGEVLDVAPRLPASKAAPTRSVERVVQERGWVEADELGRLTGVSAVPTLSRWVVSDKALADEQESLRARLARAGPLGLDVSQLSERQRLVLGSLDGFVVDDGYARAGADVSGADRLLDEHPYLAALQASPFTPPDPNGVDRAQLRAMERRGLVVERDGVWFAASAVAAAAKVVADLLSANPEGVSVSLIRETLGTTRKYALPLVAHLDAAGATRRRGDLRIAGPRLSELCGAAIQGDA